jgi:hypothetical protein
MASKSKFPLLEQMRADRNRREAEINAPLFQTIRSANSLISHLRNEMTEMQRALGTDIGKELAARIADGISMKVRQLVSIAAMKIRTPGESIVVELPVSLVRFLEPNSLEREILAQYCAQALPRLNLGVDNAPIEKKIRRYIIEIPPLNFPYHVAQD